MLLEKDRCDRQRKIPPETACVPSVKRIEYEDTTVKRTYLMLLVLRIGCFGCDFVSCCALKNGNLRGKPNKRKKRKTKIGLVSLPPSIPIFRKHRDHTNSRAERTPPTLANFRNQHPPPATYTKVRNFGNFSRLLEKKRRGRLKIGFYFFT